LEEVTMAQISNPKIFTLFYYCNKNNRNIRIQSQLKIW
jgi:hypothetical protein